MKHFKATCLYRNASIIYVVIRERPFDFYWGGGGGGQEDYIGPGFFFRLKLNPVYFF